MHVVARNKGANFVKMFFSKADYDAGTKYVTIPVASASEPHGEWCGPVGNIRTLYFVADTAAVLVEVTAFLRQA
jgi:hypothetical protein